MAQLRLPTTSFDRASDSQNNSRILRSGREISTPNGGSYSQRSQRGRINQRLTQHAVGSAIISRSPLFDDESTQAQQRRSHSNLNDYQQPLLTPAVTTRQHVRIVDPSNGPRTSELGIAPESVGRLVHGDGFGRRVNGMGTPPNQVESEVSYGTRGNELVVSQLPDFSSIQPATISRCVEVPINHVSPIRRVNDSEGTTDDDSEAIAATPPRGPFGVNDMMDIYLGHGNASQSLVRDVPLNVEVGRRVQVSVQLDTSSGRIDRDENENVASREQAHQSNPRRRRVLVESDGDEEYVPSARHEASRRQQTQRRQSSPEDGGDGRDNNRSRCHRTRPRHEERSQRQSSENNEPEQQPAREAGGRNPLNTQHSSRNRGIFSKNLRVADLTEEERIERAAYERVRKQEWRAKKKNALSFVRAPSNSGMQDGSGSISFVSQPRLQLFDGMPIGASHITLRRELSQVVRSELKSFRYVDPQVENHVTTTEILRIHHLLQNKYENGKDLLYSWTKLHVGTALKSWRTSQRGTIRDYLATLSISRQGSPRPPPPHGVSEEELIYYTKQLADDEFMKKKETMSGICTAMLEKRGCGNPMGYGGVRKANTHYIMANGKVPTVAEIKEWKTEAFNTYSRKRSMASSDQQESDRGHGPENQRPRSNIVVENEQPGVQVEEDMGSDWHDPMNGPRAFHNRYMVLYGRNPTDTEVSAWLSNGRPPLHAPST